MEKFIRTSTCNLSSDSSDSSDDNINFRHHDLFDRYFFQHNNISLTYRNPYLIYSSFCVTSFDFSEKIENIAHAK